MNLSGYDRWLTTDRRAEQADIQEEAFERWATKFRLGVDEDTARAEFTKMIDDSYPEDDIDLEDDDAEWEARQADRLEDAHVERYYGVDVDG